MGIPKLGRQGLLPEGVHRATLEEVRQAFGGGTARRVELMLALEEAVERARKAGVNRILLNGSFVTAKKEPRDVDVVFRVSEPFGDRLKRGDPDARWIADRVREGRPGLLHAFVAVDEEEWASWIHLFEGDRWYGKKGLVEVTL
jgi:hypothetical protein